MKANLDQNQKWAAYALKAIKNRKGELKGKRDDMARYLNRVKGLPAMIIMCGLGQSLATLLSVGKRDRTVPDQMLYDDLEGWFRDQGRLGKTEVLMEKVLEIDRQEYLQMQSQALKVLEWMKKFAVAYLSQEVKEGGSSTL